MENMKKTLVIGCGFLGNYVFNELSKSDFEVYGTRTCQKNNYLELFFVTSGPNCA